MPLLKSNYQLLMHTGAAGTLRCGCMANRTKCQAESRLLLAWCHVAFCFWRAARVAVPTRVCNWGARVNWASTGPGPACAQRPCNPSGARHSPDGSQYWFWCPIAQDSACSAREHNRAIIQLHWHRHTGLVFGLGLGHGQRLRGRRRKLQDFDCVSARFPSAYSPEPIFDYKDRRLQADV